ncbi:hypothetical protein [Aestuariivivens sediminicola]|uniref:hypothetical protein n=1 Tax=Aestuariivivens sediminicola TaxID=2913560 RepID=UPI001F5AE10F|nr:hypothetical protein [Aestuariivivens sediminicola]
METKILHNTWVFKISCLALIMLFHANLVYGQDEEIMQEAKITLSFNEDDGSKTIIATAQDMSGEPIEDLELYFYVKRSFSNLPIGDIFNSTDETGVIKIEFPNDLPGDSEGNVTILVKLMDSDLYEDQTIETIKNWGIPSPSPDRLDEKRSLWAAAANAPITLIVIISALIFSIWFIIFYIIYIFFKINKTGIIKSKPY